MGRESAKDPNGQQVPRKSPTSLTIGKMQIKITMRYYLTRVRMAIVKKKIKKKKNECW